MEQRISLDRAGVRSVLRLTPAFSPTELLVWLAHFSETNPAGESRTTAKRIAALTGLDARSTVPKATAALRACGCLEVIDATSKPLGYRVHLPQGYVRETQSSEDHVEGSDTSETRNSTHRYAQGESLAPQEHATAPLDDVSAHQRDAMGTKGPRMHVMYNSKPACSAFCILPENRSVNPSEPPGICPPLDPWAPYRPCRCRCGLCIRLRLLRVPLRRQSAVPACREGRHP